jgi:hypothetical protein
MLLLSARANDHDMVIISIDFDTVSLKMLESFEFLCKWMIKKLY